MTRFDEYKCCSCEETTTKPIKDEWMIIRQTHQLLCSGCAGAIEVFSEEHDN